MKQVKTREPPNTHTQVGDDEGRPPNQKQESRTHSDQSNRKLDRNGWLKTALGEINPQPAQQRRKNNNAKGIEVLRLGSRNLEQTKNTAIRISIGKEGQ